MSKGIEDRFHLSKEEQEDLIHKLIDYFEAERDEPMGHLAATLLLKYILKEIGPVLYNHGLEDAARYFHEKSDDLLELSIYIPH